MSVPLITENSFKALLDSLESKYDQAQCEEHEADQKDVRTYHGVIRFFDEMDSNPHQS